MRKRFLVIPVFLLSLFLSCAVDEVFKDPNGILQDDYNRKEIPVVFLSSLEVVRAVPSDARGPIVPNFSSEVMQYEVGIPFGTGSVKLKAEVADPAKSSITIGGYAVDSGAESPVIPVNRGDNFIEVIVTALDGSIMKYIVNAVGLAGGENYLSNLTGLTFSPNPVVNITNSPGFVFTPATNVFNDLELESANNAVMIRPTVNSGAVGSRVFINGTQMDAETVKFDLSVGLNRIEVQVVALDLSSTVYTFNLRRLAPDIYGILINEWAAIYQKDDCEDYIELMNYGTKAVTITTNFRIFIGTTAIALTKVGTSSDLSSFANVSTTAISNRTIQPGECVMVVKSGITSDYLKLFMTNKNEDFRTPPQTKFFLSDQSKLIGTRKKLHESQAYLWSESGIEEFKWSFTPDPEIMLQYSLSGTVSKLKFGFEYGVDDTADISKWKSGNRNTRTPGYSDKQ
ncbi:MAG: cadherin-like beta sandwich domain-containing protein [Spirochaetota bacterium]|jgi:hypothetical protein|nr:cadherin-like beta sandwich domain-containing protein [Spirochaetota bacterium]